MKSKDLLSQLTDFEKHLTNFSFDKLNADEAEFLKCSFLSFKANLLEKISLEKSSNPQFVKGKKCSSQNSEKYALGENWFIADSYIKIYDEVIDHHESYDTLLKSLNIEPAMKSQLYTSTLFENTTSTATVEKQILNLQSLLDDECAGEIELLEELLCIYERNALEFIGMAKLHIQHENYAELAFVAHKIKTGLTMLDTNDLHSIILQIEQVCVTDKDPKHLQFLCNCFAQEYPVVKETLQLAFDKLKNTNDL